MIRRIGDLLSEAAIALAAAGIADGRAEAALLLAHVLDTDRISIKRDPDRVVDDTGFQHLLRRRLAREPMAFITLRQGFWSLDFHTDPATLIPRADSETLIEAALAHCPDRQAVRRVLDLGTGTGCLLLAALAEFPQAFGVGVDRHFGASALAQRNATANGLADRAAFFCGDWAAALHGRFDLIFSNPPYIPTSDLMDLMPEVMRFEPASALDGGQDGLDAYRLILQAAPALLDPQGVLILELGIGQAESVAALAVQAGFAVPTSRDDAGGVARALIVARANTHRH